MLFADTPEIAEAFLSLPDNHPISTIRKAMNEAAAHGNLLGMNTLLGKFRKAFPHLMFDYFDPPKEKAD